MAKRVLKPDEQFHLRNDLQLATLAALMDSRRWEPGDIAFQGGTCLHLAYGSARFSEDLDFMIRGGLSLDGLAQEVARRLRLPPDTPSDLRVSVTHTPQRRNPHSFTVSLGGPEVIGSAKVKIELWQTEGAVMESLRIVVSTIRAAAGQQAFVPAITLDEILADKVYALGARPRLKPRDVFDLWWLFEQTSPPVVNAGALCARLQIYPRGDACATATAWLASAKERAGALTDEKAAGVVAADLARWLPSSWPMDVQQADNMLTVSVAQLLAGIAVIEDFEQACRAKAEV